MSGQRYSSSPPHSRTKPLTCSLCTKCQKLAFICLKNFLKYCTKLKFSKGKGGLPPIRPPRTAVWDNIQPTGENRFFTPMLCNLVTSISVHRNYIHPFQCLKLIWCFYQKKPVKGGGPTKWWTQSVPQTHLPPQTLLNVSLPIIMMYMIHKFCWYL